MSIQYDEAQRLLEARIGELFQAAYAITERHWTQLRRYEARLPSSWENKSDLQLRCHQVGNSIRVDWCGLRWHGSVKAGTRGSVRIYIPKPKGAHGYTVSRLLAFAKDWEKPLVEETEAQLVPIRREASQLVRAIGAVRHARQVAQRTAISSS